jgi:hypothetical protein
MQSFRDAFQNAVDRKLMPAFQPGSIRDLALNLGLSIPISVQDIITTLNNLPAAGVIYDSGRLSALYVHGSAKVYVQSDGLVSFWGSVHESGVVGDNYLFTMAFVDVKDTSGKTLVFVQTGNVKGQLDFGSSDDPWQRNGFEQVVMDQWDTIKNNTRIKSLLHVSTDPWQLTETVVIGLFIAAGIVIGEVFFFGGDSNTVCSPELYRDEQGQPGLGGRCRREFN